MSESGWSALRRRWLPRYPRSCPDGPTRPRRLTPSRELLICGDQSELRKRHQRVVAALAEFDVATIATTHEFCLAMLDGLGVLADREPAARFVEQLSDLTREVAGDLYLRRYAISGLPPLGFEAALELAQSVVENPHARLVPTALSAEDYPEAAERHAFAAEVRAEVERRKRAGRLFTYDDMLLRLRDALADPVNGTAAGDRLRSRYRIVLVDEFQDTDPIQWEILRRAFHGHVTLILIGDPKQAIYAFRGADVFSYLDAVQEADSVRTLATNWRSDTALVRSVGKLIGGAALGDARIVVRPVTASQPEHRLRTQSGEPLCRVPAPGDRTCRRCRQRTSRCPAAAKDHRGSGSGHHHPARFRCHSGPQRAEPIRLTRPTLPSSSAPTSAAKAFVTG